MKRHASMNRIYRLVWSHTHKVWIPVAEIARGRSKGSSRKLFAAALSLTVAVGHTEPIGGQIVSGNGSISQTGDTTTINQTSQTMSANWQSFNIAQSETVNFVQPNTSAIAVNRIADTRGTQILGYLNANGQVYLINPNGILFGQSAQVNVGGLVASTLDVNDASLNSNSRTFSGSGTGSVINQGTINAAGGSVALIGNSVGNQGTITAQLGTVALGAGNAVTLTFNGNNLVHMQVDQSVLNSLAENGGLIRADGGLVIMTAGARDTLLASVVNNTGVIEARSVENRNGVITLLGGMEAGTVNVGGTLGASAPAVRPEPVEGQASTGSAQANGGFIETSAAHVHVADNARVTTLAPSGNSGTWLIDPVDFTIAASGGDMTGAAVSSALAGGNFSIQSTSGASGTSGNINVNDIVAWNVNKLTLNAQNNININANLNASASASLALEFGQGAVALNNTSNIITGNGAAVNLPASTTNFTTKQGSNGAVKNYTVITSLGAQGSTTTTDLQGMDGDTALNYALGANIDATATSGWNGGAGFAPVGSSGYGLTGGVFDGLGHTISNLTINRPGTPDVGLFTYADLGAVIRNVGLMGGSVSGGAYTGGLAGENYSVISNSYATATVSGTSKVGGLVGDNQGTISNSHATGSVSGSGYVGGLAGRGLIGTISNSYATGNVTSSGHYVGGLAGLSGGTINNSYAIGNVTGTGNEVGGLVGLGNGDISNSYATGSVNGGGSGYDIGGLVGNSGGAISNSYATGAVSGGTYAGGLVGDASGTISNSYAIGNVSGSDYVGGLAGKARNTISNSYATGSVSGHDYVGGLAGYGSNSTISNSYAAGSVGGNDNVGGLMGFNSGGDISNSYATGSVSGSSYVGGLVGQNYSDISNSYAAGSVSGSSYVGGLIGEDDGSGTLTANFWDTSGRAYGLGVYGGPTGTTHPEVTGLTTAQMHAQASFVPAGTGAGNWDFTPGTGTWVIFEGQSNPLLRSFMTPLTITANNATKTYDGLAYNGSAGVSYSVTPNMANLLGTLSYTGGINGGSQTVTPGGLTSAPVQQGYIINFADGTLTVNKANLTVTANAASKTYDGLAYAGGNGVSYSGFVNGETSAVLGGALGYGGSSQGAVNAGLYTITPNGLTSGNYTISFVDSALTVNKANLIVTANAASKTYDGLAYTGGNGVSYSGFVNGETSAVLGGTLAYGGSSQGAIDASSYLITPNGLASGNYTISFASGALTVNKANLIVTANAASKTYDGLAYTGGNGVSYSGLANGETSAVLGGTLVYGGSSQGAIDASSYLITPNGLASGNYTISYANGALIVNKANLTVAANAASKTYDGLAYTGGNGVSYTGLVNGETSAVLGGTLAYGGSSQGAIDSGLYAIMPSGLTSGNYTISFVNGALTVNPITPITPAITEPTDSGRPPEPVRNVTSLLTASLTSFSGNNQPGTPGQSSFNNDTQGSGQGAGDKSFSSQSGKDSVLNTTMKIGENGPTVNIMDGGVKLPGNQQANQKNSDEI